MIAEILKKIGRYSENDLILFEKRIKTRNVKKGEILLNEGEICQTVFYSISGVFYQFSIKDEIEENIIDLHIENEWFLNAQSFTSQKPSESTIKTYSEGEILELTIESIHHLIGESPAFFQLGRMMEQSKPKQHFFDNNLTPIQKYSYILENKPALIQKFPLKIIASYLKVTPETLSRVRESLAKGKTIS
jgi:CRP-like cAMP-binding protein